MAQRNEGMAPRHAKTPRPNTEQYDNIDLLNVNSICNCKSVYRPTAEFRIRSRIT